MNTSPVSEFSILDNIDRQPWILWPDGSITPGSYKKARIFSSVTNALTTDGSFVLIGTRSQNCAKGSNRGSRMVSKK